MSGEILKTNSAKIKALRSASKEDIDALVEMRDQVAEKGRAEIAEREAVIADNQQAIDGIKANLKRLGVDVGDIGAQPVAITLNVPRALRGRRALTGDTLIERVLGVVIERDRTINADEVSDALGLGKQSNSTVRSTLYTLANRDKIRKVGPLLFAPPLKTVQSVQARIISAFERMPALYEMRANEVQKLAGSPKIGQARIHTELSIMSKPGGRLDRVNKGLYRLIKKDA